MRNAAIALVLVLCCGCGAQPKSPDVAARDAEPAAAVAAPSPLVNRVWARADSTGLPGPMRIFLSDGTLVMDSCWETYRLATWRWESDSAVVWKEDAMEIRAAVVELGAEDLVLRLDLVGGSQTERYRSAPVPYLCPDMKR